MPFMPSFMPSFMPKAWHKSLFVDSRIPNSAAKTIVPNFILNQILLEVGNKTDRSYRCFLNQRLLPNQKNKVIDMFVL